MNNYKIVRIGLLNFWLFDNEEFNFGDGKLLLRGENGSGKSVTMQSFIPLILDGNKLPSRLDPFGSKEKKIEDYLLGPSDGVQKDDSIGYLYMEVYWESMDKYVTIGMGLHARKGRGTDFWGFALKDGSRIGQDFLLYKDYGGKVLLTKNELRARLGTVNEFVSSAKEYKKMVNDLLFGFKDINAYDEFINVLLQLRSSKLSKDYNPTKLMSILSGVLQPLTDDDLRPLSEAIEDTNKTKEKIENLDRQVRSLTNFLKTFGNYNEILLYNKAREFWDQKQIIKDKNKNIFLKEEEVKKIEMRLSQVREEFARLEKEYTDNAIKLEMIDDKDLKRHTSDLENLKVEYNELLGQINYVKEGLEKLFDREKANELSLKDIDNKIYQKEKELNESSEDILSLCEEVKLLDISIAINKLIKDREVNFEYLDNRISKYKSKLNEIKLKLEEKEQLERNLNYQQEAYQKLKKEYNLQEEKLKKKEKELVIKIDEFKDRVNLLNRDNQVVKLNEDVRVKIFDYINKYSSDNYLNACNLYNRVVTDYRISVLEEKNNLSSKLKLEQDNLNILKEELEILKRNKELEYVVDEELKSTNKELESLEINYLPLYKAIEFRDEVLIEERNRIEELLISMNILNAYLVSSKDLDRVSSLKGIFLRKSTIKENNLLNYFNILDNDVLTREEIRDILVGISVDSNDVSYLSSKAYQLDFIVGYPGNKYESKYIGILKRIEEQQKKIVSKESEIEVKESIINNYKNLLSSIKNKLEFIAIEEKLFPDNRELELVSTNIRNLGVSLEILFANDKELTELIMRLSNEIEVKIQEINRVRENIQIPLNLASYKAALGQMDSLIKEVFSLRNIWNSLQEYEDRKFVLAETREDIQVDIENKNAELSLKNSSLNKMEARMKAINEILSDASYEEVREKIRILTERQNYIPPRRTDLSKEEGSLENSLAGLILEIKRLKGEIDYDKSILEIKEMILKKEYDLGYVYQDSSIDVAMILKDLAERENSDIGRAQSNYFSAFNEYRNDLLEYRVNSREIFNDNDVLVDDYANRGLATDVASRLLNQMVRYDLSAIYQGKVINIYELMNCLKEAMLECENYISTQERHLFEDILLKTVGNKIRERIQSSHDWVRDMNEIMKSTQIDSNLSFQLEWKSRQAYTEDELDTKELVRLFKIDAGMISEVDSEKLIMHFRSKIKKEFEYSDGSVESYSNVIFKVLDYRTWFEFKLYYKRKGSEKKELNNKVFSVFSGGERAKSMYVPLFAAVYAKLLSADNQALRVIALDEAFAGVDDANIREMFDILAQLNLDYILTSQALWGDYETIKNLSICELIKDEQNSAVAVRHYRWNGKVKELLET